LAAKNKFLRPGFLFNSLEEAAFRRYPQVLKVKLALMDLGMQQVLMSGSGGAVFALVQSRLQALRLAKILRKKHKSWRVFVARTL
jgi:4-diphosphocytidyl-2C-methyl-D-erythritol kinase